MTNEMMYINDETIAKIKELCDQCDIKMLSNTILGRLDKLVSYSLRNKELHDKHLISSRVFYGRVEIAHDRLFRIFSTHRGLHNIPDEFAESFIDDVGYILAWHHN